MAGNAVISAADCEMCQPVSLNLIRVSGRWNCSICPVLPPTELCFSVCLHKSSTSVWSVRNDVCPLSHWVCLQLFRNTSLFFWLQNVAKARPVLIMISLSGIKVCCNAGEVRNEQPVILPKHQQKTFIHIFIQFIDLAMWIRDMGDEHTCKPVQGHCLDGDMNP